MKKSFLFSLIVLTGITLCSCEKGISPSSTNVVEDTSDNSQVVETEAGVIPEVWFSDDVLGICFSYPQGYSQLPDSSTVEVVAPDLPDTNEKAIFWLETSDAYDRSAAVIADQDLTTASGVEVDRWTVALGGEEAVVLDGMPGQDLQRRVYVVHEETLYMLGFMPTHSANTAANDQMEALFTAITNSWAWTPCSAGG
jgi:hypothetical protein